MSTPGGARNVRGLAQRADVTLWPVEHGADRDDEVNLARNGRDHGWNPVPAYHESVERPHPAGPEPVLTDHGLRGPQTSARWSSGFPTPATPVPTKGWGRYGGTLPVAFLKSGRVLFLRFDGQGRFRSSVAPAGLQTFGRLRTVTALPGGGLVVTTDNGGGQDRILRNRP